MADKKDKVLVNCRKCKYAGEEFNYLVSCSNKERNLNNAKMGCFDRACNYFKSK